MKLFSRYSTDPFVDLLFNALLGFTLLFFISLIYFNLEVTEKTVDLKAEYIISITWPENLLDDIDLWVRDSPGETVSYLRKDAGQLHLDRDDRGSMNDTVVIEGEEIVYSINQELVTLRGLIDGEYTVNVFYYNKKSNVLVEVLTNIERVNPSVKTVFVRRVILTHEDEETTIFRFTPTSEGAIVNVNYTDSQLTPYSLEPSK